jgi:hypothetical protein
VGEIDREFGTQNTPPPPRWENVAAVLRLFGYPAAAANTFARPEAHWDLDLASALSEAIFSSEFSVTTDWRYELEEMLDAYRILLARLMIESTVQSSGDDGSASIEVKSDGVSQRASIAHDPGRPDRVAARLHPLVPCHISFHRSRAYEKSDTLCEVALLNETWEQVRQELGAFFDEIFVPADREPVGLAGGA